MPNVDAVNIHTECARYTLFSGLGYEGLRHQCNPCYEIYKSLAEIEERRATPTCSRVASLENTS